MYSFPNNLRGSYMGRLGSNYVNTTGSCLEFFYWLVSNATTDLPVFSVILVSEEKIETPVQSTYGNTPIGWSRFFAILPPGVNQIVIQGTRSHDGVSGLAIDDILFQSCTEFGKSLCNFTLSIKCEIY